MTRSLPISLSAIAPVLVLALAASCGHTDMTKDAFEASKRNGGDGPGTTDVSADSGTIIVMDKGATPGAPAMDCSAVATQQFDPVAMEPFVLTADLEQQVSSAMSVMEPDHLATQMMGIDGSDRNYRDIERSQDVDVPGLGTIRGYRYRDAGRGVNLDAGQDNRPDDGNNFATVFPTASTRAASWDLGLERRIGEALGDETAGSKNNMMLAPCMNIIRHPFWGRTQETYGEDMYHIGRMASALTVGIQQHVVACAKHWAANNIEKQRATQNAIMDEQTLREVYGRHFEMVVQDGGIGCIMASYNKINDIKATQNKHVLREVLKGPVEQGGYGYEGFVLTDWWAMPGDQNVRSVEAAQAETIEAVDAGLDVEVPWTLHYTQSTLANANPTYVREAAKRVLTQKYRFGSAMSTDPWGLQTPVTTLDGGSIAPNEAHELLAEEAAIKSAVLLKNGSANAPVLPLSGVTSIAVLGVQQLFTQVSSSVPKSCGVVGTDDIGQGNFSERECVFDFAIDPALGDRGSSRVNGDPARTIGPFDGIQRVAGSGVTVTHSNSAADAASADAVVVVVGYTPGDEGEEYYIAEGGDRSTLNLPPGHNELVDAALGLNKPTVIVIQSGSIVNLPWLNHANQNQATFWAGYPGMRGGIAMGKLIFGQANFSGKMPMAWPAESELPVFKETETATTMDYFFGYRLFDKRQHVDGQAVNMVFPFGYGLSYSTFEYSNLQIPCTEATTEAIFNVTIDIQNTSAVAGDEVALLFVKPPTKPVGVTGHRPWKELKSFARVSVPAGGSTTAELPLRIRDLRRWEGGENGAWVIDPGTYTVAVAKNADDAEATTNTGTFTIPAPGN